MTDEQLRTIYNHANPGVHTGGLRAVFNAGRAAGLEEAAKEMEESGNTKLTGWIDWCRAQAKG